MTSESAAIIGLYQRRAAAWVKDRGNRLVDGAWLDRFRRLLFPGAAVLDIGCGSGEPIARFLVEKGYAVTGVDSAPATISICASLFPAQSWRVADMRILSLGATFDGILAWNSFFHLTPDDQRRMFPIFRAHSTPRAALMFIGGPAHGEASGEYRGEPLYHASLDGAEYPALLEENGFEVVDHVVEDPSCARHTICLAQSRQGPAGPAPSTERDARFDLANHGEYDEDIHDQKGRT